MPDLSRLLEIREKTLSALKACEGKDWAEAEGELHASDSEIPNWILLSEYGDISLSHARFLEIVGPYLNQVDGFDFTVSYQVFRDGVLWHLDDLMSNDEIARGYSVGELGSRPLQWRGGGSPFYRPGPQTGMKRQ